jgi:hypothetical protein
MVKYDVSSGASGAVQGASMGGSIGGPPGAVVGSVIGAAKGFFGAKKKKKKKISTLDKKQQQLNDEQYAALRGEGPLADLYSYDPEAANKVFDENYAKYAYRDLKEKDIPELTGQFRSQGLMQSSYAGDAVGKLIREVQERLGGQRAKYLYDIEQANKEAKRGAVENLQNRQTFAYQKDKPQSNPLSGFSAGDFGDLQDTILKYAPGGVN